MAVTAQDVKTLREKTGAGMMDCKKALQEVDGNFDSAIEFLKKQGLAKAIKKGGRIAAEGLVFTKTEGNQSVILELNCETDFVGKNEDFLKLGDDLATVVLKNKPATVEAALALAVGEKNVEQIINEHISIIGEKLSLRRFELVESQEGSKVTLYSHNGGRIAVLIEIKGDAVTDAVSRDLAMQIAAMSPQYLDKSEVPQATLDAEKAIQMEQLKASGKPENILEKIIGGKLDKFAGEMSLLQQVYVKDMGGKKKVFEHLKDVDPTAKVIQFHRYAVGEGIEKREEDFAEEVKKMAQ